MKQAFSILLVALAATLAGCTTVPDSIVQQPMTMRTQQTMRPAAPNGTIYQVASYRPMFEDRRARMVGDILTILISEKTSASKSAADSGSKTGSIAFAAPKVFGIPATSTAQAALATSTSNKFEEKGAASTGNTFTGTITVTVVDVLPNGNLVVSGEKQVALDKAVEYIRFSGVVNADNITASNVVSSTQVADARVEYRTNSRIDSSQIMSQMAKFFFSIMPL